MENKYQLSRIHNYVMGLMSKEEMYEMEREALDDPFLQDAIDGYRKQQGVDMQRLSLLQLRLAKKLKNKSAEKNSRYYSWHRLTIGLAAAVLFITACSLILFRYFNQIKLKEDTEVLLMEQNMRIESLALTGSDVLPTQGWNQFNEELNSELRDFSGQAELKVQFHVHDGKAQDLKILDSDDPNLTKTIQEFIQQKTSWKGTEASIWIKINP